METIMELRDLRAVPMRTKSKIPSNLIILACQWAARARPSRALPPIINTVKSKKLPSTEVRTITIQLSSYLHRCLCKSRALPSCSMSSFRDYPAHQKPNWFSSWKTINNKSNFDSTKRIQSCTPILEVI